MEKRKKALLIALCLGDGHINKRDNCLQITHSIKQKSYIEVNEKGTKASAATIATVDENSANVPIDIEFDKPFIYIIKQSNSDDILFFGVVYTPTLANNETNFCN